ncbi:hypothetical protein EDB80DRAFT_866903 [Ilyonectria destructans]|nr:hypothetical protein EDB80DRAFT_866903 [Ilyonectria destructans]
MAEIDMEVDMTRPLEMDGHVDDDFIDFDTDMVDQPELASLQNEDNQKLAEATANLDDGTHDIELIESFEEHAEGAAIPEEEDLGGTENIEDDLDQTGHDASHKSEHDYHATEAGARSLSQNPEEDDGYVEIPNDADKNRQDAADETHVSDHEIDYEFEEQAGQHNLQSELDLDVEKNSAPLSTEAAVEHATEDGVLQSVGDVATEDPEGDDGEHGDYGDHQEQPEQDEITYDDDEGDVPEATTFQDDETAPSGSVEAVVAEKLDEESQTKDEGLSEENGDFHEQQAEKQTTPQHEEAENVEFDEYDVTAEDQGDLQDGANFEQQDPSESGENSAAASDTEFPAITVQYKGDEFPCFSNSSDGFFTETSIIDETMDKVLSGFRNELASEIAQEEELVFQVDELGLEFAESCLQDSLSSVTLRQILEIFDLLVKNQDPESSRTLYTYLFTKPSASKRLESLIESATAGKGLDEVIHLFESPVAAAASVLEANTADDELEERLDNYDSPGHEVERINEEAVENDVEYDAEEGADLVVSPNDNHDSNGDDQDAADAGYIEGDTVDPAPEDAIATNDEASNAAAIEDDVESNGKRATPHPGLFPTCYYPDFCLCNTCVAGYVEEHGREEGGFRHALHFGRPLERVDANGESPMLPNSLRKHGHSISDFSITFSTTEADQSFIAYNESESNPLMNPELDEDAEVDDEVDLEAGGLTNEQNLTDPDGTNVGTAATSTTTTLKDDDETGSINANPATTELLDTTEAADGDDIGEIDWNDDPEADEEIQSPSVVGKRSRGDDETDVEDEQDVKRRRP